MLSAPVVRKALFTAIVISAAFALPPNARAAVGAPQVCSPSSSCTVGEFLYDDSYTLITDATCTLTAKYPNGDPYLSEVMTPSGDGWYSHSFTTPATTGYYRAEVCCTPNSEKICLDKSFEVKVSEGGGSGATAEEIATAVWGYSGRTLSGFGNLVTDIWDSSNRTLSSFGGLVSSIWSNSSRTLTEDLAQSSDVAEIKETVGENRLLLEQLVNKPIIQNSLEEEAPDLTQKIGETKTVANQLYINQQYLRSQISLASGKWSGISEKELLNLVMEVNRVLGEEADFSSGSSFFAQVNWLRGAWNWSQVEEIHDQSKAIKKTLLAVQTSLGTKGKSAAAQSELRSTLSYLDTLEKLIGDTTDRSSAKTLFGKISEMGDLAGVFDEREAEVNKYIAEAKTTKDAGLQSKVDDLLRKILSVNKIPKAGAVLAVSTKSAPVEKVLKNKLLGMMALINANRLLLAKGAGVAFSNTWLEEGSIIFKTLVTNPSSLISQKVPLKYYLPSEVRQEDVIEVDSGLSVNYDPEKDQYFVEGEFTLAPGETRTFLVKTEDVWGVSQTEIDSMRKQAEELAKPLEKTSFFAQGVTLKSDIDVSLDKIVALQDAANTPEQRIRAYREAQIELEGAKQKMDKLKELVTQAGSTGTLFGFVGGAQTMAVWGLIIIMAVGFVFLALYMRMVTNNGSLPKKGKKETKKDAGAGGKPGTGFNFGRFAKAALPMILVAVSSATISGLVVAKSLSGVKSEDVVLGEQEEGVGVEETSGEELGVGGADVIRIVVPKGSSVNVRKEASLDSEIIMRLDVSYEAERIGEEGEWTKVALRSADALESMTEGWVNNKFVYEVVSASQGTRVTIIEILETPTGWLRVREVPEGKEIGKVYPGEVYGASAQEGDWWQIELSDGSLGWISKLYAKESAN